MAESKPSDTEMPARDIWSLRQVSIIFSFQKTTLYFPIRYHSRQQNFEAHDRNKINEGVGKSLFVIFVVYRSQ